VQGGLQTVASTFTCTFGKGTLSLKKLQPAAAASSQQQQKENNRSQRIKGAAPEVSGSQTNPPSCSLSTKLQVAIGIALRAPMNTATEPRLYMSCKGVRCVLTFIRFIVQPHWLLCDQHPDLRRDPPGIVGPVWEPHSTVGCAVRGEEECLAKGHPRPKAPGSRGVCVPP